MKHRSAAVIVGILISMGAVCLLLGAYLRSDGFMQKAAGLVQEQAAELLATRVEVGAVSVDSFHSLSLRDLVIYDQQDAVLAKAKSAQVSFSMLSLLREPSAAAVSKVSLVSPEVWLSQQADNRWNYEAIIEGGSSRNAFAGKVSVQDGQLTARVQGQQLALTDLQGQLDFAAQPSVRLTLEGALQGATVKASGDIGGARQTLSLEGEGIQVEDYLPFLPAGTLPDNVTVNGGRVDRLVLAAVKTGEDLSFSGQAEFSNGQADIMGTAVEDIGGLFAFNEKEGTLFVHAQAAEQRAALHGKIRWDTGDPYLQLVAESEGFDPSQVLTNIPFHGSVAFSATIYGQLSAPRLDGTFRSAAGSAYGYAFSDATAKVHYEDDRIAVRELSVQAFGGSVQGEGEFVTTDQSYLAHLKLQNVDLSALADFVPGATGRLQADIGLQGKGQDLTQMAVYGSAAVLQGSYHGFAVERADASFYRMGNALTLDFLSARLPGGGSLGLEGSVDGDSLNMSFYASGADLSQVQALEPQADMTGRADMQGTVQGPLANPRVQVSFTAVDGALFKQPYTHLTGAASGSLDGIGIDSFTMENGGEPVWLVDGSIGFTGEKRVDLRIDTTGARMEDIAALVAPDQPITGNVDNIIEITGTLDNPSAVGYIHFYQGSYRGMLLSGMDGDYTIRDGVTTLQDFHIYSPLVDMDLNGTINAEQELNLRVAAHEIQVDRFGSHLPYPLSGRGRFDGTIGGTLNSPLFEGRLDAREMVVNGQTVTDAHGDVRYRGHRVYLDHFGFKQNDGSYELKARANTETGELDGKLTVDNGDINALLAMANLKNDKLAGRLNGTILLGGTLANPLAQLNGFVGQGSIAGYDVHDINMNLSLANHVITLDQFQGKQGVSGVFAAKGTADLEGPLQVQFSAQGIDAGILGKLAGIDAKVRGSVNLDAQLGGTMAEPAADLSVAIMNGGAGTAMFDSLTGIFNLRQGIIEVNQFVVKKLLNQQEYKVSAAGKIPLAALDANADELDRKDQFDLTLSLDHADLSILPILSKNVDWAVGATKGSLRITGTRNQPLFNGALSLSDGAMKFKQLAQPITDMNVYAVFSGTHFSLNKCTGRLGQGTYSLQGTSEFYGIQPRNYNFSLQADALQADCPFYQGPLTAALTLKEGEIFGHKHPQLSGRIFIDRAMVTIPSVPDTGSSLPTVLLDLDLELGKKVRFFSPLLYDMQLAGSAHFGGSTTHPHTAGAIYAQKGTVSYLKTVFKVREAEARFGQANSFLPAVTLRADTKINHTQVFLALNGLADQMALSLTSSPELSETQIVQLLTLRSAYDRNNGFGSEMSSMIDVGLQMSFLGEVESAMRNALNLDEFTVVRDTSTSKKTADNSAHEVYNIKMGKYITDKLMLRYIQSFGNEGRKVGIEYDFNNQLGLAFDWDQEHDYTAGIEARFKF